MTWQDFLMIAMGVSAVGLSLLIANQISHEGFKRLFILIAVSALLVTTAVGGYTYHSASKQSADMRLQIDLSRAAAASAEEEQTTDRKLNRLREALIDANDAAGRFLRGAPPGFGSPPRIEDESDGPALIAAKARLADLETSVAVRRSPWAAARQATLFCLGLILLILLAYWPLRWALIGFHQEPTYPSGSRAEGFSDEEPEHHSSEFFPQHPADRYNSGNKIGVAAALAGLIGLVAFVLLQLEDTSAPSQSAANAEADRLDMEADRLEANKVAAIASQRVVAPLPSPVARQTPTLTKSWLIGTWAGAEHNPKNDPTASCETDVTITFHSDGTFTDGGASGRYQTDGRTITYFQRQTVADIAASPDEPFTPESLADINASVSVLDLHTFQEDGDKWRRCSTS